MIGKTPVAATPINLGSILSVDILKKGSQEEFKKSFQELCGLEYLFLINSGLSCFYLILEALKKMDNRTEVILPAYTAPSLIVAVRKSNLKPCLCDISLDDFNMDASLLGGIVSKETLAILGIHMFGIADADLTATKSRFPGVFILEDCAQSLGSKINNKPVGCSADISFFSFAKGKNMPTYRGGCIGTNSEKFAVAITQEVNIIKEQGLGFKLFLPLELIALSLAVRPQIYGVLHSFISFFKEQYVPKDFAARKYTDFQANFGLSMLKKIEGFNARRHDNGIRLVEGLKGLDWLMLPKIPASTYPVFNRLPVVFKDLKKRENAEKKLWEAGIETSLMYFKPLHHIFNLGYRQDEFPNACYFAKHLLTLPVHPYLDSDDIDLMINIINEA